MSDVCTSLSGTPVDGAVLSFTIPEITVGDYEATLVLRNSGVIPTQKMDVSMKIKRFRVVSRLDTIPLLTPPANNVEYGLEDSEDQVHVHVPHKVFAKDHSILVADNVHVCLNLMLTPSEDSDHRDLNNCIPVYDKRQLNAGILPEGMHHYELVLKDGEKVIESSAVGIQ